MKRSCKGCYAAVTGAHPLYGEPHECELGFKNNKKGHPLVECPKPNSWSKLDDCKRARGGTCCS